MPPGVTEASLARDNLIAGNENLATRGVVISSGQNITRGALLGRVTSGGEYILSLSGAADGSEVPRAIAAYDVDATAAAKTTTVYERGDFNENAITFGTAHTADSTRDALREKGIFMHAPGVTA